MKDTSLIAASVCALLLALALFIRIELVRRDFDATVRESHRTTEGYDQRFIDMVKRLEVELATRASFGYPGGKDPMTGIERQVVPSAAAAAPSATSAAAKATAPAKQAIPSREADPVQLTAIISEGAGKKATAVVMNGERSMTVDVGDIVAGRKVTKISNEGIWMESGSTVFHYDIYGKREKKPLEVSSRVEASR
jgi:hypothetical protein